VRRLFTTAELRRRGMTVGQLRWATEHGRLTAIAHGVYAEGTSPPNALERAVAPVVRTGGVARGEIAGVLLGLDAVRIVPPVRMRRRVSGITEVHGLQCTNGFETLVDLAALLDDDRWEQALESALRKQLVTLDDFDDVTSSRIRRVLALRPPGAPPTESLLETMMVQLARTIPGLAPPDRQVVVIDEHGQFVARVDLAWQDDGVFAELDGQQHKGQPVYDARRQTAVAAATGWLCGRFTWTEVTRFPRSTARRLDQLIKRSRR
jgi:hypothetical protein